MLESSHMTVVRGNVWSYHMPWGEIMGFMERSTTDAELSLLPHDPESLAHMVKWSLYRKVVSFLYQHKQLGGE